ncbi:MAG: autotransporter outer membrane beta-barrel domain-containing protein [Deltaproteobacteria bacterium]|jgi:hypothetical protein|nr:autotransporter outer membrane beta-barrel domain-containing protein [Deltaproteobacteria bacterium]
MNKLLENGGIWSSLYRLIKNSRLLTILDIVMTLIILSIVILCFVTLAVAEDLVYDPLTTVFTDIPDDIQGRQRFYPTTSPSNNTVKVGYDITAYILGGLIETEEASKLIESSHNTLWIGTDDKHKPINVSQGITGGDAGIRFAPEPGSVVKAEYNKLYITNVIGAGLSGGSAVIFNSIGSVAYANHNEVTIVNSSFNVHSAKYFMTAGLARIFYNPWGDSLDANGNGIANYNSMTFINSWAKYVWAAAVTYASDTSGDHVQDVEANYNTLYIKDSGPHSQNPYVEAAHEIGDVAAVYVEKCFMGDLKAGNNTVILEGNTRVSNVYGTWYQYSWLDNSPRSKIEVFLGNTLNVVLPKEGGIEVLGDVGNFQYFNFLFKNNSKDGTVGLVAGNQIYLTDDLPMSYPVEDPEAAVAEAVANLEVAAENQVSRKVSIGRIDLTYGKSLPADGTTFELLSAAGGIIAGDFDQKTAKGSMGPFIELNYDLILSSNSLMAILRQSRPYSQLEDPVSAENGSLAFIGQGSDLVASKFFDKGVSFDSDGSGINLPSPTCPNPAFAISYGKSSYDNGGEFELTGYNAVLGISCQMQASFGSVGFGVFAEGGKADYDTHHSFTDMPAIDGGGGIDYIGGGVSGRLDFNPGSYGRFYLQLGGRYGTVDLDYRSLGFEPLEGGPLSYESRNSYKGAFFGSGYLFNIRKNALMNTFLNYRWTRIGSDHVLTNVGETIDFDKSDSQVLNLGARLTGKVNDSVNAYVGMSLFYEFDGETQARTYERPIAQVSVKGATGGIELGMNYRKSAESPFAVGLSFQGYSGRRRGVEGTAQLSYNF